MKGYEKLLAVLIAGTLVAGVVSLSVRDVTPTAISTPTPTVTDTEEPSPTPTVTDTEEPSPTPTEEATPTETPSPTPTETVRPEPPRTPDTGVASTAAFAGLLLLGAALVYLARRRLV